MLDSIPDDIMHELSNIVRDIEESNFNKEKFNDYLAGEIEKEFSVDFNSKINHYLQETFTFYEAQSSIVKNEMFSFQDSIFREFLDALDQYMISTNTNNTLKFSPHYLPEITVQKPWVNFQRKGEYNPMHNHSGLLSYVIWYKIPFYMEDEENLSGFRSDNRTSNGKFNFYSSYSDSRGPGILAHFPLSVDKRYEGTICVFPSSLNHSVNPFYSSDEYRITFSGNAFIKDHATSRDKFIKHIKKFNKAKF